MVDSGNVLFRRNVPKNLSEKNLSKASTIQQIYHTVGYDAVAVGPHDLSGGIDLLKGNPAGTIPWLSANILDHQHKPLFKPWVIKEAAGLKIGIIGFTAANAKLPGKFHIGSWQDTLPAIVSTLSSQCDLILLLSNATKEENIAIATELQEIDITIEADLRSGNRPPKIVNNTLFTQTVSQGKYFGNLKIMFDPSNTGWIKQQGKPVKNTESATAQNLYRFSFIGLSKAITDDPTIRALLDKQK